MILRGLSLISRAVPPHFILIPAMMGLPMKFYFPPGGRFLLQPLIVLKVKSSLVIAKYNGFML
jgi:hypothetical protein